MNKKYLENKLDDLIKGQARLEKLITQVDTKQDKQYTSVNAKIDSVIEGVNTNFKSVNANFKSVNAKLDTVIKIVKENCGSPKSSATKSKSPAPSSSNVSRTQRVYASKK